MADEKIYIVKEKNSWIAYTEEDKNLTGSAETPFGALDALAIEKTFDRATEIDPYMLTAQLANDGINDAKNILSALKVAMKESPEAVKFIETAEECMEEVQKILVEAVDKVVDGDEA